MIEYKKSASKFILSQGKAAAIRLYNAIENLPLGDVKRLQGGKGTIPLYRLRVGEYRIVFCIEQDHIIVLRADSRGDIYKK
ncbi:MAG: type II toxin-antitoxin system RelE/ParE family toxin [Lachnospiraceae bacterium]|jgi:mRNA interferase RelE/StbE|nr:type II toxin-antitoxin system RelE/ParE family toxin [Lachnospiraceae bacterium]